MITVNDERGVSLSTDGKLLAAATGQKIIVWRLQDGLTVQRLERDGHKAEISQTAFSPDGQHIVSGADDNLALVWNVKTGDVVHRLKGHEGAVYDVAFSSDGTQIATRSRDSLRLWTALSGDLLHAITNLESKGSTKILFSPDGSRIATRSDTSRSGGTAVEVLDCRTGERIAKLRATPHSRGGVITKGAAQIGETLGGKYLACFTQSGDSARRMSRLRSAIPLLAFTPVSQVRNQLALSWGVQTYTVPQVEHTDDMINQVDVVLKETGHGEEGDMLVVVAGMPPGVSGSTNSIRVHTVGEELGYPVGTP